MTNEHRGRAGQQCKLWALQGQDYCARHQHDGGAGPSNPDNLEHRCIARSTRTGSQCKKPALRGATVCRNHGAGSPLVQAKAQERLDRMVEPALHQLAHIMNKPGTSDSDRLRAVQMLLDRTMPKERKVEVTHKPWEVTLQAIIRDAPDGTAIGGGTILPRELMSETVIDAEVVDEGQDLHTPTLEEIEAQEREDRKRRITESGKPDWFKQDRLEQLRRQYPDQGRPNLHSTVDSRNAR